MDYPNKLYKKGVFYRRLGYSVVPVHGDSFPTRGKAAAVRWACYQQQHAGVDELKSWFLERQYGGLAIVCGEVSQLAVLDFDDPHKAELFASLHPQLTQTCTVLSGKRKLPHYYFHVPSGVKTRSRSTTGIDWQYNGRYVVTAPTRIGDAVWSVSHDVLPLTLSQSDVDTINAFLDSQTTVHKPQIATDVQPMLHEHPPTLLSASQLTPERILHHYDSQLHRGRNNALFATACWVRDCGGSVEQASVLVHTHAHQQAIAPHAPESTDTRLSEALRTINSAFSRPAGFRSGNRYRYIPNSLREKLLSVKQTALLRVLEAIVSAGWRAGKQFTRAMLLKLCERSRIGDWSVRKAIAALTPDEKQVFERSAKPAFAAKDSGDKPPQLNAIELRATEPTQNRGRPVQYYTVPDLRDLCFDFNVVWSAGDPIAEDELRSAAIYRQALHHHLICRRPGQYHRGWLANRLGVSVRTINRYNVRLNLKLTPVYKRRFITWKTLGHMPDDMDQYRMGAFLEDEFGKRYPPLLPIARRLLRNKHQVVLHQRMANRYEVTAPIIDPLPDSIASAAPHAAFKLPEHAAESTVPSESLPVAPAYTSTTTPEVNPHHVLSDAEHEMVNQLHTVADGTLAHARAVSLVAQYGRFAIEDVLLTLEQRQHSVQNPVAFMISLLQQRYGSTSSHTVALAESLYIAIEWHSPQNKMRWRKCLELINIHGEAAIATVVSQLNNVPHGTLKNAAGYVVLQLNQQHVAASTPNSKQVTQHLVDVSRLVSPHHAMSTATAEKLVSNYGERAVSFAIQVMQSRNNIVNPSGFIISFLRSNAKR